MCSEFRTTSTTVSEMSKDWAGDMAAYVGAEVKRLRGKRSGQWLSGRARELGYGISRTTISELENGKRKYVTTAELVVLARALNTTPVALVYPGPYDDIIDVLPGEPAVQRDAAQWFSGMMDGDPWPGSTAVDAAEYERNAARLRAARRLLELESNRHSVLLYLAEVKRDPAGYSGDQRDALLEHLQQRAEDVQREIDALHAGGGGDGG